MDLPSGSMVFWIASAAVIVVVFLVTFALWRRSSGQGTDNFHTFASFLVIMPAVWVLFVIFIAMFAYIGDDAKFKNASTAAATALGTLGTIVGFITGNAAGSAGKEKAETRAESAQEHARHSDDQLKALFSMGPENMIEQARAKFPSLFN